LQRIDAYIGRIEALEADNARLREWVLSKVLYSVLKFLLRTVIQQFSFVFDLNFRELDNERADKATLRQLF
jgi:hypothetical protein